MSLFTFRVRVLSVILIRPKTNKQKKTKRKGGTDEIQNVRARVTVTLEKLRLLP